MKKRFILFLLSAIFVLTGIIAVGCGKSVNADQAYKHMESFVVSITSDDSPFSHGSINGIETDFYINNFKSKNDADEYVDDDQNYLMLNAVSLNYIYKYYSELGSVNKKYDCTALYNSLSILESKYHDLKILSSELNNLGENAQNFVYNGYFSKYKVSLKDFVQQAFVTSSALGDVLINKANIAFTLGTDEQTAEDLTKYVDYYSMMIFKDFSDFFLGSCKGQVIDSTTYVITKNKMDLYCSNVLNKNNKEMTKETTVEFMTMSKAMAEERRMYNIAINGFSYYDYTTKYENSIEAYEKAESDADSFYEKIQRYLININGPIQIYYAYLINNVKVN